MPYKKLTKLSNNSEEKEINNRLSSIWRELAYLRTLGGGGGGGETNTASSVGGGLSVYSTKIGVDLRFNSFSATDFDLSSNVFSIDYVNGQAASALTKGFLTATDWTTFNNKQNALVSGTSIKTVNSTSLLGSGDVAVQETLVSGTNIKTVNSTSLLGSGDIAVQATLVSGTNIKTVNSTSLLGSGDVAVQATLVSGTNIKTINGSSVLGSGNLTVSASPAGSDKQFQYNSAGSFGASSMLTQETNQVLVTGTDAATTALMVKGAATLTQSPFRVQRSDGLDFFRVDQGGGLQIFGQCSGPVGNAFGGSIEVSYAGGTGTISSFNRNDSSYKILNFAGSSYNFSVSGTNRLTINTSGRTFIGANTSATAVLHLAAGTATASTAPLKFTSGTNLSSPEAGTMEYNGRFFLTDTDATQRHIVQAASSSKTTAGAPFTNDGYITVVINGVSVKLMTTA